MFFQKKRCIAMLLAGGQGSRLKVLTENTAKPAVPFGGKYRIIDFPLSNCVNSGIDTVGILTQYQPLELNEYIGNGQPWVSVSRVCFLCILGLQTGTERLPSAGSSPLQLTFQNCLQVHLVWLLPNVFLNV